MNAFHRPRVSLIQVNQTCEAATTLLAASVDSHYISPCRFNLLQPKALHMLFLEGCGAWLLLPLPLSPPIHPFVSFSSSLYLSRCPPRGLPLSVQMSTTRSKDFRVWEVLDASNRMSIDIGCFTLSSSPFFNFIFLFFFICFVLADTPSELAIITVYYFRLLSSFPLSFY